MEKHSQNKTKARPVRTFAEHVEAWTFFTFQYLLNWSLPVSPQKPTARIAPVTLRNAATMAFTHCLQHRRRETETQSPRVCQQTKA